MALTHGGTGGVPPVDDVPPVVGAVPPVVGAVPPVVPPVAGVPPVAVPPVLTTPPVDSVPPVVELPPVVPAGGVYGACSPQPHAIELAKRTAAAPPNSVRRRAKLDFRERERLGWIIDESLFLVGNS
jgi:hypothetical protein